MAGDEDVEVVDDHVAHEGVGGDYIQGGEEDEVVGEGTERGRVAPMGEQCLGGGRKRRGM